MAEEKEITLDELKKQVAQQQKSANENVQRVQLIVFKQAEEEYALPIGQIKEVVLTPTIAKVPQTPPYIKGVANIRGNLIAIIDLEEKFRLSKTEEQPQARGNYTLVIESEECKIGVLVKEVPNTLTVSIDSIDSSSNIMHYSALDENALKGIVKINNRMIILLDMIQLMQNEEMKNYTKI